MKYRVCQDKGTKRFIVQKKFLLWWIFIEGDNHCDGSFDYIDQAEKFIEKHKKIGKKEIIKYL